MSDVRKRPRGRPALKAGEASVPFHLRLSASDYDQACRVAQKNGVSVPQVFRTAFRMALKKPPTRDEP